MHMFDEQTSKTTIKRNPYLLCYVETFMGLSYILPLFECM
jgi:hypothetical protein